jgi:hypothetical protein
MAETFVAINDWCHKLLRGITRRTVLAPCSLDDGSLAVYYRVEPEFLPDAYYSLGGCHTLGGLPLDQVSTGRWRVTDGSKLAVLEAAGGFDLTRLDRRCWGDLRLKPPGSLWPMLSGELLAYGTGMLRGCGPCGRLDSDLDVVSVRIGALQRYPWFPPGAVQKCFFESTNLIYGDAFGELEQLWQRRADLGFLDQIARSLRMFHDWRQLPYATHPPLNAAAVMNLHLRSQALWKGPPRSGRALLRRLEFILDHTILDSSVVTVAPPRPQQNTNQNTSGSSGALDEWRDSSGYDGWLPGVE